MLVLTVTLLLSSPQKTVNKESYKSVAVSKADNTRTKKVTSSSSVLAKRFLRVCQAEVPPISLDTIYFLDKQWEITFNIFDRLFKWNDKGELVNSVALKTDQKDDNTYIITIRDDITFHNGEKLDASAVKFSIDRLTDPYHKTTGYDLFKSIRHVTVIDPYKVRIETHQPDYLLLRKLSAVQLIPPQYFKKVGAKAFGKHPIGSAGFKFHKWKQNGQIELVRNDQYWGEKPHLEKLIFMFIPTNKLSKKEQLQALLEGKIDLVTELPGIHSLRVQKNPKTKVIKVTNQPKVYKMQLNSLKKPFDNKEIRKAVNIALNRDMLIRVLANGNGRKIAVNTLPIQFGHKSSLKPYKYDPQEARELMEKAGYDTLTIKIAATNTTELVAEAIKKDLEKIGINSTLTIMTKKQLAASLAEPKIKKNGIWPYDMAIYSGVDYFLHVGYLYGSSVYSKGYWSTTNSEEVDRVFEELQVTLDKIKQKQLCHKLEQLAYDNYWYTPIFQVISTYGADKSLSLNHNSIPILDLSRAEFE